MAERWKSVSLPFTLSSRKRKLPPVVNGAVYCASLLVFIVFSTPIHAECIKNETEVVSGNGSVVKLRDYLCKSADSDRAKLRIQYLRLNDFAMSALVHGAMPADQRRFFSNTRIVETVVYREVKKLFDKFGRDVRIEEKSDLSLNAPVAGKSWFSMYSDTGSAKGRRIPELIRPFASWVSFPQPRALLQLQKGQDLPPGYTRHNRTIYWRYLSRSAFERFDEKVSEYNRLIARNLREHFGFNSEYARANRRDVELPLYLGRHRWPREFVVLVAKQKDVVDGGCEGIGRWSVGFSNREFFFDVVTIENISGRMLTIEAANGTYADSHELRTQSESRRIHKKRPKPLPWDPVSLDNGDRIVLPVRINLPFPSDIKDFYLAGPGPKPEFTDFVYGPEIGLKGVEVDGGLINLDKRSSNLLALTAGFEEGSCPFVYYWDAASERWRTHGKVIHEAEGASAEASETVTLDGLVTKFRIAEEESELALINQAGLVLELDTGQKLNLPPAQDELLAKDQSYIPILFGQALPVEFDTPPIPEGVKVVRSHFTVTGYYRRYSDIIAQHYQPERSSVLPQLKGLPQ